MTNPATYITDHLDTWSSAIKTKSSAGRGDGKKQELYGTKKLRELILELAIRGLIVPQHKSDQPASELLHEIAIEKAQLIKDRKIKKRKENPDSEQELPFDIPNSWVWTRLVEVAEIGPRNALPDDLSVGFVPMPLISTSYDGTHGQEIKSWSEIKKGYTHFANGDIAIAKITPCFENSKAAIFGNLENGYGAGTTELHVARLIGEFVNSRFLLFYLKAPMFLLKGKPKMTGSAGQKRIPASYFASNPLPLPPLAEQHRIVAKVDELMAICDQLEQQQEDSVRSHSTLVKALLDALTAESERGQFAQAWQRIASHFDTLFTTESSIDQLKQTILQLAVMGKVAEQYSEDEITHSGQNAELNLKGKKIPKWACPIEEDEKPFDIPFSWRWTRLGNVASLKHGHAFSSEFFTEEPSSFVLTTPGNFYETGGFRDRGSKRKYYEGPVDSEFIFDPGDLIIPMTEQAAGLLGSPAFIPNDGRTYIHNQRLGKMIFKKDVVHPEYAFWFFNSSFFRSELARTCTGMKVRHTSPDRVLRALVPVPPLAEQHRIVAKTEELIALCDCLKERLQTARATQLQLADSLVDAAIR